MVFSVCNNRSGSYCVLSNPIYPQTVFIKILSMSLVFISITHLFILVAFDDLFRHWGVSKEELDKKRIELTTKIAYYNDRVKHVEEIERIIGEHEAVKFYNERHDE